MFNGNTRLLDVVSKMNSRQRGLLIGALADSIEGDLLKETADGQTETTGEKARIPVAAGGRFKVTLLEKLSHVIMGKSLKDLYGFNYNKDAGNSARTFWQTSRENIRQYLTEDNMGPVMEKAEDLRASAEMETDPELQQVKRISAQMLEQVAAINREAKAIVTDPDKYIAAIKNDSSIPEAQKDLYFKMIDDVLQNRGALGVKAKEIVKQMEDIQADVKSLPADMPQVQKDVLIARAEEQLKQKSAELQKLYDDYVPAKERAASMPKPEFSEAEEQTIAERVAGDEELKGEFADIMRIKDEKKRTAKLSKFKKGVLAEKPTTTKKPAPGWEGYKEFITFRDPERIAFYEN